MYLKMHTVDGTNGAFTAISLKPRALDWISNLNTPAIAPNPINPSPWAPRIQFVSLPPSWRMVDSNRAAIPEPSLPG